MADELGRFKYMLSHLKNLVKRHQSDIFLSTTIVLVALISFGIGYLIAPEKDNQPIIIQNPTMTASVEKSVEDNIEEIRQGMFVGSINSNKYHWPDCSSVKKISSENQIWFNSEKEAQEAGYVRCGNFEKYSP